MDFLLARPYADAAVRIDLRLPCVDCSYCDLAFIPKPSSPLPPMLVELKWGKPTDTALAQIRERGCPAAFAGLSGECVLVGATYDEGTCEHRCEIERAGL